MFAVTREQKQGDGENCGFFGGGGVVHDLVERTQVGGDLVRANDTANNLRKCTGFLFLP